MNLTTGVIPVFQRADIEKVTANICNNQQIHYASMLQTGIAFSGICPCIRLSSQNLKNYSSETDVTW